MKILVDFYLFNSKKEGLEYDKNIALSTIIKDVNNFIIEVNKEMDFDKLVNRWSELITLLDKYGNIPLFKCLKIQKKFKICYGGYIKFRIVYDKVDQIITFKNNDNKNVNNFYLIYNYILKYLSKEDIYNLSLINKNSYNIIINNKIFKENIFFINSCDNEEEKERKIINFNKFFGGHSYNLYEVKKLGMFIGKKYIYLLIQSIETYNVEIMRLKKGNIDEHEIIFRDEWTNYYMFDNVIYQLKFTKDKIKLNKIDKNEDEIIFMSINVFNLGESFDSEYFYNFKESNDIYIVTSELKIYKLNRNKKKLKLFFDESKKNKCFKKFINKCKIRQYSKYYIFIKNIFFLSLTKLFIYDLSNKKLIICFPNIRGVELVQKLDKYYYVLDYRNIYLLSNKDFEINYQYKKYHNDFCMNELLIVDSFLNNMQISNNNYINNEDILHDNSNNFIKKLKLKNMFMKLSENYLCSDYYNDEQALYIKLLKINKCSNNNFNFNKLNEIIEYKKNIRIDMNKFIKKIAFEENIKDKDKKELIRNLKCHIFFNGLNDIVINAKDCFWIYHYNLESNEKIHKVNKDKSNNQILLKYDKVIIKTNEIIRYHNIVFYDKIFIVFKQKSFKILYYNLNLNNIVDKNEKNKSKNKKNKNVKILSLEDIEDENNDIYVDTPIFLFNSFHKLFLICSFSEEDKAYALFEIKIQSDKITLLNSFKIELSRNEKNKNDEILMYAQLIYDQKFLVLFTSNAIYLFKNDNDKNIFKEIKRKVHSIIGYFTVRQLNEEESCFIAQDDRSNKCLFFDVSSWAI